MIGGGHKGAAGFKIDDIKAELNKNKITAEHKQAKTNSIEKTGQTEPQRALKYNFRLLIFNYIRCLSFI